MPIGVGVVGLGGMASTRMRARPEYERARNYYVNAHQVLKMNVSSVPQQRRVQDKW